MGFLLLGLDQFLSKTAFARQNRVKQAAADTKLTHHLLVVAPVESLKNRLVARRSFITLGHIAPANHWGQASGHHFGQIVHIGLRGSGVKKFVQATVAVALKQNAGHVVAQRRSIVNRVDQNSILHHQIVVLHGLSAQPCARPFQTGVPLYPQSRCCHHPAVAPTEAGRPKTTGL